MNTLYRWIAIAPLATLAVAVAPVRAFTDSNAELKEASADRAARVVVTGKAVKPQTAWVPVSAKKLDGFKPVLPPEPQPETRLAKAELPAQTAAVARR